VKGDSGTQPPFLGPVRQVHQRGLALLGNPMLNKDRAFTPTERRTLGLEGLLPPGILTMEEQKALELERLARKHDDLERYIGLAGIQDRNETLFHRLLVDHPDELLPIVYTPTVGLACQAYSQTMRRPRGVWVTPDDIDRVPEILLNAGRFDVRLVVATDNERILGLGDLGAGGMGIAIGKLALYSAVAGVHPDLTLPVSLDVGTDNEELLADPYYLGWRNPRLRGDPYLAVTDAFVDALGKVYPRAVLQWEDLKQHTAIEVLERYRTQTPSFNDDIQGTAAVTLAGILAALRVSGESLARQRVLLVGAGAAGTGIARLVGLALLQEGLPAREVRRRVVLLDSDGVLFQGRNPLHEDQRDLALRESEVHELGLRADELRDLEAVVSRVRPTVLVGTSGTPGSFTRRAVVEMAKHVALPVILPLSNPTSQAEATPAEILSWTEGRALVATGSPFDPVGHDGRRVEVGQANNVFIFPGVGLGLIAGEAPETTDQMFLEAARTLAAAVTPARLAAGALYPPLSELRTISRAIAIRVAAMAGGRPASQGEDPVAAVDGLMWYPEYQTYVP
jgi:malate dehydrogenase (oxaloacetate-decarboxylating)